MIQSNKILDISAEQRHTSLMQMTAVAIRPLRSEEDAQAFRSLNEEWITRYFALESKDVETLTDPENTIIKKGGQILMAEAGGSVAGCVALIPMESGIFELSKMAVSPQYQGFGIGRVLLEHAIDHARFLGARSLFLGSNTKLKNAVHLYESVGFRHVPPEDLPPTPYTRADVFMKLLL